MSPTDNAKPSNEDDLDEWRLGKLEQKLDDILAEMKDYRVLVHKVTGLEKSRDRIVGGLVTIATGMVLLAVKVLFGIEVEVSNEGIQIIYEYLTW